MDRMGAVIIVSEKRRILALGESAGVEGEERDSGTGGGLL